MAKQILDWVREAMSFARAAAAATVSNCMCLLLYNFSMHYVVVASWFIIVALIACLSQNFVSILMCMSKFVYSNTYSARLFRNVHLQY